MTRDQLSTLGFCQLAQLVILTFEFSGEGCEGLLSGLFNLVAAFSCDSRSEWESFKISADPDTGAFDHACVFLGERRTVEFGVVHVADMFVGFTVTVVALNDLIKQRRESFV